MIADRFLASERILAALHIAGGVILFFASTMTRFGTVLRRAHRIRVVLHADHRAEQLALVSPDARSRA
jgi:hypothetical protein